MSLVSVFGQWTVNYRRKYRTRRGRSMTVSPTQQLQEREVPHHTVVRYSATLCSHHMKHTGMAKARDIAGRTGLWRLWVAAVVTFCAHGERQHNKAPGTLPKPYNSYTCVLRLALPPILPSRSLLSKQCHQSLLLLCSIDVRCCY